MARAKAARDAAKAGASLEQQLQKKLMPLVKRGEAFENDGDFAAAIGLYKEALAGFNKEGVQRPKLVERIALAEQTMEDEMDYES